MFNHINNPGSTYNSGVHGTREMLDSMKVEIANELGINLEQGHKGELPSRVAGLMVKKMIEQQEKTMSGKDE